jgi:hypothetical protein
MEILAKLFGGMPRIKVMRLFLLNPEQPFDSSDIIARSRISSGDARSILANFLSMKLIKRKSFIKENTDRYGRIKKKRVAGFVLREDFPYIRELKSFLVEGEFFKQEDLAKRFRPAGRIHMLVASGIFVQNTQSKLDLLIVGDHLKKNFIQKTVTILESELGKELSYVVFDTADFNYRVSMYDKLIRDVFDYPHERLIASKEYTTFVLPS